MQPSFTIMMPVVRPPVFMPFSIASVQAQTRDNFELCIICDGAPWETIAFAEEAARQDPRIKVFPFPKGERNGEVHRHKVLQQACSDFVCQIADDDLWFPNHLAEASRLMADVEFGNLLHITLLDINEERFSAPMADIAYHRATKGMLDGTDNLFGPTACAYRLETYRRLPVGWSPAPPGGPSDLHMWQKFLNLPDIKIGSRLVLTSLHLLTSFRGEHTESERVEEMKRYARIVASEDERRRLELRVFHEKANHFVHCQKRVEDLKARVSRLENKLAKLSGPGPTDNRAKA